MVKIISQNVRGLNMNEKHRGLFMYAKEKAEIICLQETHSTVDTEKFWRNKFGGQCYWSHGTSASRGVGILIKKNCEVQIIDSFSDKEGRIIGVTYKECEQKFLLVNIYAPNNDDPHFFTELMRMLEGT